VLSLSIVAALVAAVALGRSVLSLSIVAALVAAVALSTTLCPAICCRRLLLIFGRMTHVDHRFEP